MLRIGCFALDASYQGTPLGVPRTSAEKKPASAAAYLDSRSQLAILPHCRPGWQFFLTSSIAETRNLLQSASNEIVPPGSTWGKGDFGRTVDEEAFEKIRSYLRK